MMTEAEAWREIAKEFAGAESYMSGSGLCRARLMIAEKHEMSRGTTIAMISRLYDYVDSYTWAYEPRFYERCVDGEWEDAVDFSQDREARCLAALWLAEEAEHE